jgi:hypothetical protein
MIWASRAPLPAGQTTNGADGAVDLPAGDLSANHE